MTGVAVTDWSGAAIQINSYDEYGAPAPGNAGRFGYTGQVWLPETGLYHYKNRAYNPELGRFMQTDPIGVNGGMNLYAYVGGDPVNYTDPLGLDPDDVITITVPRIRCPLGSVCDREAIRNFFDDWSRRIAAEAARTIGEWAAELAGQVAADLEVAACDTIRSALNARPPGGPPLSVMQILGGVSQMSGSTEFVSLGVVGSARASTLTGGVSTSLAVNHEQGQFSVFSAVLMGTGASPTDRQPRSGTPVSHHVRSIQRFARGVVRGGAAANVQIGFTGARVGELSGGSFIVQAGNFAASMGEGGAFAVGGGFGSFVGGVAQLAGGELVCDM